MYAVLRTWDVQIVSIKNTFMWKEASFIHGVGGLGPLGYTAADAADWRLARSDLLSLQIIRITDQQELIRHGGESLAVNWSLFPYRSFKDRKRGER